MPAPTKKHKPSRILALDLMRGYFLLSIIINHLNYTSSLGWLTFHGELFVSSAEGFFFISGILLGLVRGAKMLEKPIKLIATMLLKRAFRLYAIYVISVVLFTLIGWWFFMDSPYLKYGIAQPEIGFVALVGETLSLDYIYGWLDYLRLYAIFLVASPFAIWMLRRNLWWLVLALSLALWYFSPFYEWPVGLYIQPFNWQLLFFGGMIIGFYWQQISAWWKKLPRTIKTTTITSALTITVFSLYLNIHLAFSGKISEEAFLAVGPVRDYLQVFFDKENLPIARLILFSAWFGSFFWLVNKLRDNIARLFGWLLLSFGNNSLYVYIVHGFFVFFIALLLPPMSPPANLLITACVIALILIMIRYKVLMKIIPR